MVVAPDAANPLSYVPKPDAVDADADSGVEEEEDSIAVAEEEDSTVEVEEEDSTAVGAVHPGEDIETPYNLRLFSSGISRARSFTFNLIFSLHFIFQNCFFIL